MLQEQLHITYMLIASKFVAKMDRKTDTYLDGPIITILLFSENQIK